MSPTVRIDDEVYDRLKQRAEPFVDTPNTVLRRILGLDPVEDLGARWSPVETEPGDKPESEEAVVEPKQAARNREPAKGRRSKKVISKKKPQRTRVPSGALLPEDRYWMPLLTSLVDLGGSAPFREVVDRVGDILKEDLTELDYEPLKSGGVRWKNRLQFVRLRMIEQGLMLRESGRGVWAISEDGREYVERHKSGVA